jgi:hypothetical protein
MLHPVSQGQDAACREGRQQQEEEPDRGEEQQQVTLEGLGASSEKVSSLGCSMQQVIVWAVHAYADIANLS